MREPSRPTILLAAAAALALAGALIPRPAPDPVPSLRPIPVGDGSADLPALRDIVAIGNGATPTFLHFYNPASPNGADSISHLAHLMAAHGEGARFIAIIQPSPANVALARRQLASLGIPIVPDYGGRIARAYGVYATPRAVIFDASGRLHFQGPYGDVALPTNRLASSAEAITADPYAVEGTPHAGYGTAVVTAPDDGP